jgi:hypothetical protein
MWALPILSLAELLRSALRSAKHRPRPVRPVSESVRFSAPPLVISLDDEAYCRAGASQSRSTIDAAVTTAYHQDSRPGQVDIKAVIDGGACP